MAVDTRNKRASAVNYVRRGFAPIPPVPGTSNASEGWRAQNTHIYAGIPAPPAITYVPSGHIWIGVALAP